MTAELQRGIAERLKQVLGMDRVENASVWASAAGLSRTYVSAILERARKGTLGDVGVNSLFDLANSAKVSPAWLAFGFGSPTDELPLLFALPPKLRALVRRLPPNTYPEQLVRQAAMVVDIIGEKDLPEDVWQDYLDGLRKEARRVGLELAAGRLDERGVKR